MNHARSTLFSALRLLAVATACMAGTAHADDYADVNQLLRAGKLSEASSKADAYLVTKPTDPQMRFLKGVIQRTSGKQPEAIATFTKLTEDYPELPEPYNNLAVLYAGLGQYDKARGALEMAIRTNPSYATAHENLGDVYARLASQAYNKALQLDTDNAAVPPKLAIIREVFKPNLSNPKPVAATAKPAPVVAPVTPPAVTPPAVPAPASAPSAAAPATRPGVVPAPPAPAAVKAPATDNTSKDAADVEAAVQAWAKAWSSKNMSAYLGAYGKAFVPAGKQPRSAWEQDRRDRIVGKSTITVKIDNLTVKVDGNQAVARFRQSYRADALSVSSRKTLEMVKAGEQWLIVKESTGN